MNYARKPEHDFGVISTRENLPKPRKGGFETRPYRMRNVTMITTRGNRPLVLCLCALYFPNQAYNPCITH